MSTIHWVRLQAGPSAQTRGPESRGVSALGDADWPSERELKVTAVLYARLGAGAHLRETGRLADRIGGMHNCIPMNLVLRERGTDPTLTAEERLVYDAIVREHRLPGGAIRLIGESSPHGSRRAQVGEGPRASGAQVMRPRQAARRGPRR